MHVRLALHVSTRRRLRYQWACCFAWGMTLWHGCGWSRCKRTSRLARSVALRGVGGHATLLGAWRCGACWLAGNAPPPATAPARSSASRLVGCRHGDLRRAQEARADAPAGAACTETGAVQQDEEHLHKAWFRNCALRGCPSCCSRPLPFPFGRPTPPTSSSTRGRPAAVRSTTRGRPAAAWATWTFER